MKIDLLVSGTLNTGDQLSEDQSQGKINGIMIVGPYADDNSTITVKVRDKKNTHVLANRLGLHVVQSITDQDYGHRSQGGMSDIIGTFMAPQLTEEMAAGFIDALEKDAAFIRALYLPLGHISLSKDTELDVQLDFGSAEADVSTKIYTVHHFDAPDRYFLYDEIDRTSETLDRVRRIYLNLGTQGLISDDGNNDVTTLDVQLDIDGGRTYLFDAEGILASHNIFGNNETRMEDSVLKIFESSEALPSTVRCKLSNVGGSLDPSIIFVRELVPNDVEKSTAQNLSDLIQRVENLERESPEMVKAYQKAGAIPSKDQLKEAKMISDKQNA